MLAPVIVGDSGDRAYAQIGTQPAAERCSLSSNSIAWSAFTAIATSTALRSLKGGPRDVLLPVLRLADRYGASVRGATRVAAGRPSYVLLRLVRWASSGMSTCALGVPQPVTGSHPAEAG